MTQRGVDRYGAERAIKASDLPAPSRLLLYTLLTHVTNGTLGVPAKYAPTFSALGAESGLARGTLSKHLNQLEDDGWLIRKRPTKARAMHGHQRTGYEITPPVHLVNQFTSRTGSGDEPLEEPQVAAGTRDEPVHETNQSGSRAEHSPTYRPSPSSPTEKKGGAGGRRKPETPIPDIFPTTDAMRSWADGRGLTVDLDFETERFINHAQTNDRRCRDWVAAWRNWMLAAQKRTGERRPTGTYGAAGHQPYRNPPDQSVYDEGI